MLTNSYVMHVLAAQTSIKAHSDFLFVISNKQAPKIGAHGWRAFVRDNGV